MSNSELFAELVPPSEFKHASFENYFPDKTFPSQSMAASTASSFAQQFGSKGESTLGIYLDGGFGVGKTHLLAAIYAEAKCKSLFGAFIAYTSMIGYLGFQESIKAFAKYDLLCIDEFELDDPGDTMIFSRFLKELSAKGVRFATTSNTPPTALGEGRFAADGFQREIQSVADRFTICRIDGEDYRHRKGEFSFIPSTELQAQALIRSEQRVLIEEFKDILFFLSTVHQSKYAKVAEQFDLVLLQNVFEIQDQFEGLRFVSFIDRSYESGIKVSFTGTPLDKVFREDHLQGAYRKKYLRCLSRLSAMSL
ncbi:MAG: cell division protein ZapE [Actinomycetes bacterium]